MSEAMVIKYFLNVRDCTFRLSDIEDILAPMIIREYAINRQNHLAADLVSHIGLPAIVIVNVLGAFRVPGVSSCRTRRRWCPVYPCPSRQFIRHCLRQVGRYFLDVEQGEVVFHHITYHALVLPAHIGGKLTHKLLVAE